MDHSENTPPVTLDHQEESILAFERMRELSGSGGEHAEAYRIATQLYGANPPKEYIDQVEQGLLGKDI